jgi:hypothetical protein
MHYLHVSAANYRRIATKIAMFVANVVRVPDMNFQENCSNVSQDIFLANVSCLPDMNSYENPFKGSLVEPKMYIPLHVKCL